VVAALTAVALLQLLASASGVPSHDDFGVEVGALTAFLTLAVTALWHTAAALIVDIRQRRESVPERMAT
jgi:hypothetical protein